MSDVVVKVESVGGADIGVDDQGVIKGDDGFSPVVSFEQIEDGYKLTIVDANGAHEANILNGAPGQDGGPGPQGIPGADGQNGSDGFSPTVSVSEITGGHRITITDANGDHSVDVMDGENGADGQDGTSPAVTFGVISGGHTMTVTDKTHPTGQTINIMDGVPGPKGDTGDTGSAGPTGPAGPDGVSPVITVTDISGGHRVTITDAEHPTGQSFDVMDGAGAVESVNGKTGAVELSASDVNALPLAGGTMSGAINMDGNKVSNLPTPTASGDAVPKGYADGLLAPYRTSAAQDVIDAGKQAKIAASGMLKGDGNGGVTAATAGTDYQAPLVAGTDYETPAGAKALGLTGASVGDLVRVNAVDANGKPTSWRKAPLCEVKTNPNLLDNWYFVGGGSQLGDGVFPINQRGQTAYISGGYTIDRWIQYATANLVLESDGFRLGAIGNGCYLCNKLPGSLANDILGKIVTLSVLFENDGQKYLNYKSMTIPSSLPTSEIRIDAVGIDSNFELSLQVNSVTIFPMFFCLTEVTANSPLLKAVKLELGSEQTLAHNEGTEESPVWVLNEIPDCGEELAKCQRYYQLFRTESLRPTYGEDCRPTMATEQPTKGTLTKNGVTYYTLSAES